MIRLEGDDRRVYLDENGYLVFVDVLGVDAKGTIRVTLMESVPIRYPFTWDILWSPQSLDEGKAVLLEGDMARMAWRLHDMEKERIRKLRKETELMINTIRMVTKNKDHDKEKTKTDRRGTQGL